MPPNSNFRLPRAHRFRPKLDLTIMAPNHGGDPLGSILGPMGSHWGKKWVKTVKNYHAPKFEFSTTPRSTISAKIWPYGYGAKSRLGPPRVHLGANEVPLGDRKWVKTVKNYYAPKFEFSTTPSHQFWPKFDLTVMAPNHGGDPLGSISGPMGSHWDQKKWDKTLKNTMPQNSNFRVIDFGHNWTLRLWHQITVGTPLGPYRGQWCPIGTKKLVKIVKNYHALKFEFSTTPRSSIWAKIGPYSYGVKSRCGHPRVHLGANGVQLGPKNGSKP